MTITIASKAPSIRRREKRRSFWQRSLDQARITGDWFRIPKLYTRKSASQIASDIRRSHLRLTNHQRVRGFRTAEVWEATWQPTDVGAPGDCEVWVRYGGEKLNWNLNIHSQLPPHENVTNC